MIFTETKFSGVYIIDLEPHEDERGSFARTYCAKEFEKLGLQLCAAQCNISYNREKGTLRGMHFQAAPFSEAKLVTCLAGAIYDVIVDLRPNSPTYGQWQSFELSALRPRSMLYVPENLAHGFQTLESDTEVFYQMSEFYHPVASKGVRWNDPAFNITWPDRQPILSEKDRHYPDFAA
jgi:dTDP-4-dehydrorhamnose 3,5-epimerase